MGLDPVEVAVLRPRTAMALPRAVTGAVTGATIWVPPRIESSPLVRGPVPAGALPPVMGADPVEVAVLRPRTAMALPRAVTGAVTGATIWVPPRIESSLLVRGPVPAGALPPDAGAEPPAGAVVVAVLSPSTLTALPVTVIGTFTETSAWVPERIPSLPLVVAAGAEGVAAAGAAAGAAALLSDSPSTLMALSATVIGMSTGTTACVPDPTLSSPDVVAGAGAGADAAGVAGPLAVETPRTEIALPITVMGAVIGATTCVPDPIPSSPEVLSAAFAAVAPSRVIPPAMSVPQRACFTKVRMMLLLTSNRWGTRGIARLLLPRRAARIDSVGGDVGGEHRRCRQGIVGSAARRHGELRGEGRGGRERGEPPRRTPAGPGGG
ncbi:hypothetical protein RS86_00517 [Microbacterium azadirachtae]|uniref:Uncharacterized protein n=1 Tax=Microbacterium azadirachtae TaxID=582680 RepID=A0A0F0LR08_9MICO|nr:hypothetical protein RS86_00517 [Microbacterium azadirachtae]